MEAQPPSLLLSCSSSISQSIVLHCTSFLVIYTSWWIVGDPQTLTLKMCASLFVFSCNYPSQPSIMAVWAPFDKHPDNLPSPSRASQVHSAPSLLVLGVHVNVHAESPRPGGVKRLNKKCHCYGSDWTKSIFFPKALHLINLRRIWTIPSRPSMAATIKPVLPSESSRWQSRLFSSNNNSTC